MTQSPRKNGQHVCTLRHRSRSLTKETRRKRLTLSILAATSMSLIDQILVTGSPVASTGWLGVHGAFRLNPALLPPVVTSLVGEGIAVLWDFGAASIEDFTLETALGRRSNTVNCTHTAVVSYCQAKVQRKTVYSYDKHEKTLRTTKARRCICSTLVGLSRVRYLRRYSRSCAWQAHTCRVRTANKVTCDAGSNIFSQSNWLLKWGRALVWEWLSDCGRRWWRW